MLQLLVLVLVLSNTLAALFLGILFLKMTSEKKVVAGGPQHEEPAVEHALRPQQLKQPAGEPEQIQHLPPPVPEAVLRAWAQVTIKALKVVKLRRKAASLMTHACRSEAV